MAPGWPAEPPRFPQEGGGQRGAQPSGVGRGEEGDPLLAFSRLSFPAAFQGSQPSAEALFQGPQMHPTPCYSRRGLCRGDYKCPGGSHPPRGASAAWVSLPHTLTTRLASPACAQTHRLHSFTHFFSKCLPDARTTCEVLCKVLGKQQESRSLPWPSQAGEEGGKMDMKQTPWKLA